MKLHSDKKGSDSVYISIRISGKMNRLLTASAKTSGRSKTKEAYFRLDDHLNRFCAALESDSVFSVK